MAKKAKKKRKRLKVISYIVPIGDNLDVTLYTIARAHQPEVVITKEHITEESIYAAIRKLRTEFFPYAYQFDMREELKATSGRKREEFDTEVPELIDNGKLIVHKEQRARGRPLTCYAIPGELGL